MKLFLILPFLLTGIVCASAQTNARAVMHTNGVVVTPTNFWANAPVSTNSLSNALTTNSSATVNATSRVTFTLLGVASGTATTPSLTYASGTNSFGTFAATALGVGPYLGFSVDGTRRFYISTNAIHAEFPITFSSSAISGATRTNLGLGGTDSPTFAQINVGAINVTGYGMIGYNGEIDLEEKDLTAGPGYDWNFGGSGIQYAGSIAFETSTSAGITRTNLGLGATNDATFNTVAVGNGSLSNAAVRLGGTNYGLFRTTGPDRVGLLINGVAALNVYTSTVSATTFTANNFSGGFSVSAGAQITFSGGSLVAQTRTNLGLGATWLTNTNADNFRAAIGAGTVNENMDVEFTTVTTEGLYDRDTGNLVLDMLNHYLAKSGEAILEWNTTKVQINRPLAYATLTNIATNAPADTTNVARWVEFRVGTNSFRMPLYQ